MVTLNENMTKWGKQGRLPKYLEIVSGWLLSTGDRYCQKEEVGQQRALRQHETLQGRSAILKMLVDTINKYEIGYDE